MLKENITSSRQVKPELEDISLEGQLFSEGPLCVDRRGFAEQDKTLPRVELVGPFLHFSSPFALNCFSVITTKLTHNKTAVLSPFHK